MATATEAQDRASVPPIVLPITSRGLALTDRVCWAVLGAAMVAAAALILYLNRGTTFFLDELAWVYLTPRLGAGDMLDPHNGHLILTSRLVYKGLLETVGTEYLAFRLLHVATVLLSAGLLYALVKRWLGPVLALAPAVVLLFFGSAWQHVLIPVGFTIVFSVAAGLAALLALQRGDRRGDVAACALFVLSVATYTTGLPFLVGVAVSVLLRPDRRRRAWIFLVPLVLYAAWWVWSLSSAASAEGETTLANVLLIPGYAADSLASVLAAVTGLGNDFEPGPFVEPGWGRVVAVVAVAALVLRFRDRRPPALLWVGIGIVLTYWSLGALAADTTSRVPWAPRYMYLGAVGVLLIATAAAAGVRFTRVGLAAVVAATAISLATNVAFLRDGGRYFRSEYSAPALSAFTVIELARDRVDPGFNTEDVLPDESPVGTTAALYLEVADRYGSPALSVSELERQPEPAREYADRLSASALGVTLEPTSAASPPRGCDTVRRPAGAATIEAPLAPGGAEIRDPRGAAAEVSLRRFADIAAVELGTVPPGAAARLRVPPDRAPDHPWTASVSGPRSIELCPLR
jgi:hypothetical protein